MGLLLEKHDALHADALHADALSMICIIICIIICIMICSNLKIISVVEFEVLICMFALTFV